MEAPNIPQEVSAFHADQIVVDMHVDMILQHRLFGYDVSKFHRPWFRRQPFFRHADVPRMVEGGYTLSILGIHYWPWESKRAWREAKKQLSYMKLVAERDDRVRLAHTAADVENAKKDGKLAFMAGIEGAHILAGNGDLVDEFEELGVVYLTLAHFSKNSAATPGMGRGKDQSSGLTSFGRDLIGRLNRARILVDVSHVNRPGVLEACETTTSPVIASHTTAAGYFDHNRGLTDDGIRAVAETGGVVGIMVSPQFLTGKFNASYEAVVDHSMHVVDLVGPEHLAVGTDYEGWIPTIPNDVRDCRDMPLFTRKLLERGLNKSEISGALGGNFLRVLREVRG